MTEEQRSSVSEPRRGRQGICCCPLFNLWCGCSVVLSTWGRGEWLESFFFKKWPGLRTQLDLIQCSGAGAGMNVEVILTNKLYSVQHLLSVSHQTKWETIKDTIEEG